MNDVQLRESMTRLIADEPPYPLDVPSVIAAGRRVRRTHKLRTAAAATLGVAMFVTAATVAVPLLNDRPTRATPPAAGQKPTVTPDQRSAPTAAPTRATPAVASIRGEIVRGILAASPDDWTFKWADSSDSNWEVAGNADDGDGAGRIFVSAMRSQVGAMTVHPCQDPEFAQGVKCVEIPQQDGRVLVVRHLARGRSGHATTYVQLFGTEGISVTAESGNFAIDLPQPGRLSSQAKRPLKVTRDLPLYDVDRLTSLVRAVDEHVQKCLDGGCS